MLTEDAMKYLRSLSGHQAYNSIEGMAYPSEIVSIPEKSRLESLERFQAAPNRIEHTALLDSSRAFIDYVNRFKGTATSIYLDIFGEEPLFAAVIDHHDPNAPSWNRHRATFGPRVSLEWEAWTGLHERGAVSQQDLLRFFEQRAQDLFRPEPAIMLGHLGRFEEVEKHTYESAMNLDNGNISVTYVKGTAQRKVEFPHTVQVQIPVIENEEPLVLDGRLRYRTSEGKIAFTFTFKQDPTQILRDTLRGLAVSIKAETGAHCYEGRIEGGRR